MNINGPFWVTFYINLSQNEINARVGWFQGELKQRLFWEHVREPELNRTVMTNKQLDWNPVGVRVVKNVASSLLYCPAKTPLAWGVLLSIESVSTFDVIENLRLIHPF